MFTREDISRTKQEFWTVFGKYMAPVPSGEGLKINWVNYNTGVKGIYFRMDTLSDVSSIYVSLEHPDRDIRELHFEQFLEYKDILHEILGEEWEWQRDVLVNDKEGSRIYCELSNVSVLNKDQWPELISFFKQRMIGLDRFWENGKWGF